MHIRNVPKEKTLKNNSYMWVCPNNRVVVCSINTDQADGTFRMMNNESFFLKNEFFWAVLLLVYSFGTKYANAS